MSKLVSVVIPVKNGEEFLDEVLTSVLSQETDFAYEVVVLDSGSVDRSLEIIKRQDVQLIQIKPSEFNHGLTRNFGIEKSEGEFIAFLTQDATPVDDQWLQNLATPLRENPEVAGVFGKHLPRNGCDPIIAANLHYHFDKLISPVRKYWRKDASYESNKNVYVFFSNNNACVRRTVWEKIPFRCVEMSEDQWWAQDILESGYLKCYEPNAVVYHSHTYSPVQWFKRQFDEYQAYIRMGLVEKPSILNTLKSVWHLSIGNVKQILLMPNLSIKQKVYWSFQRVLNNLGMIAGQFFGARYNSIPNVIARKFLSEQSQKMES